MPVLPLIKRTGQWLSAKFIQEKMDNTLVAESVPFGIALDALLFLMFVGLMIRQIKERNFDFAKNKISYFIIVWIIYNILSVFNPWAQSQLAWVFTVRSMAVLALIQLGNGMVVRR